MFGRRGYHAASLNDVADELGMTPAGLYHYFRSKDEMLPAVVQAAVDHLVEPLARDGDGERPDSLQRIRAFFRRYAENACNDLGRCLANTMPDDLPPPYGDSVHAQRRMLDQAVRTMLRAAMAEGSVRPCNEVATTAMMFGSFNAMSRWWSPNGALSPTQAADEMLDLILRGLTLADLPAPAEAA